jgi:hypothetical protein
MRRPERVVAGGHEPRISAETVPAKVLEISEAVHV